MGFNSAFKGLIYSILGAFTKLQKATITSSCLSVRPSARLFTWNNSTTTGWMFMTFDV